MNDDSAEWMARYKTSPAMGPEQQMDGGGLDAARVGLVIAIGNQSEGRQVLGTCSPELITRLETIKASRLTGPEQFTAGLCVMAATEWLREFRDQMRLRSATDPVLEWVTVQLPREVWNELQEVR